MSNSCYLFIFIVIFIPKIYGQQKCDHVSAVNGSYSVVYLKKVLPRDNDCDHDINFKYVYEGPASLWTIQNKDTFLYINIPDRNSTKCYFLLLKEHKMRRCYVNNFWKVTERLIVFTTYNPSKEAFVGDVNRYMKYGCTNQEKMVAFYSKCVNSPVLRINEYRDYLKQYYEEEKIHYQLYATAGQNTIKLLDDSVFSLFTVIILKYCLSFYFIF
ncbi:uncharacterized protein LOC130895344 [Diorhabda carinulata]|uniref:uncharacterized protein LOC130895344 n=1 Tax=Diorhabda carinulata TaxID=1163345 RepID=UPI0025A16EC4|nr:uncharacterized protein LOC130895344 [Diorhabda carinulata]